MVKIALDPAMYHADLSVADEVRKAADLGLRVPRAVPACRLVLLAPLPQGRRRADRRGQEGDAAETGVQILRPWSRCSTGRRRTSRNARRRCATGGGCWRSPPSWNARSSTPSSPATPTTRCASEHAFYKSMEELTPDFERYGIGLNLEAHPYDFSETNDDAVQIIRGLNKPWVNYVFCAPHAFHLSDGAGDLRRMMEYAGDEADPPAHRRLLQPPGQRRQPLHHQPTRRRRPHPPAQRDRQRRHRLGRVLRHPARRRASTASPPSACSAGRRTPTTSTAGCWSG